MNRSSVPRFYLYALLGAVCLLFQAGCSGNNSTTSAQFTASATAPAPGLVKLVEKSRSGARVVIDVVLFGPEPTLDLDGFQFGIKIGDSSLVRLAAQMTYPQTALVAGDGQTIFIDVDGMSDPSLIRVVTAKQGGGAGNGFATASTVVIELPFDVQAAGATSMALVGVGNTPPEAIDSTRVPIGDVRFDAANATVTGVTTGGGGY